LRVAKKEDLIEKIREQKMLQAEKRAASGK
jgi:hypothetical protein